MNDVPPSVISKSAPIRDNPAPKYFLKPNDSLRKINAKTMVKIGVEHCIILVTDADVPSGIIFIPIF